MSTLADRLNVYASSRPPIIEVIMKYLKRFIRLILFIPIIPLWMSYTFMSFIVESIIPLLMWLSDQKDNDLYSCTKKLVKFPIFIWGKP